MELPDLSSFDEYKELTHAAAEDYNAGRAKEALEKFLTLEKHNPNNAKLHEVLSYVYVKLENPAEAQKHYQRYVELLLEQHPDWKKPPTFDEAVDEVFKRHGSLKEIEEKWEQEMEEGAEEISNTLPFDLSLAYMANGDYQKAEQVATRFRDIVQERISGQKR